MIGLQYGTFTGTIFKPKGTPDRAPPGFSPRSGASSMKSRISRLTASGRSSWGTWPVRGMTTVVDPAISAPNFAAWETGRILSFSPQMMSVGVSTASISRRAIVGYGASPR